ncbi:uncharacterized protein LOC132795808 [Drosophila nasuta]|uniref:uncharacterized protein LOC132795808 n=1 Tax=Drosophila nasuta TaxID=42062 RepID=UPI00295E979A|nr:uncharacterized protein LOC132795808 [Drosophila nasuta]
MKVITLCLLVLVSASCLLSVNANAAGPNAVGFEDFDLDEFEAQLDDEYMDFETFGFIRSVRKALKKALKTVRGVNCIIKEVNEILSASTGYVDAIDACGTAVPKDVLAIVNSCKTIISLCNDVINANTKLCGTSEDGTKTTSKKCFWNLFKTVMKLTRKINTTLKQMASLPSDTSSCFVDATNSVKTSYNNFLPNIDTCVDSM